MSGIERGLEKVATAIEETSSTVSGAGEDRLTRVELGIKSMELSFTKSSNDLHLLVKEHFSRQDTANQLLSEATNRLSDTIETTFKEVFEAAMTKNQMPSDMVKLIVKIMGLIILGLSFALIFALTGIQLRFIPDFHTQSHAQLLPHLERYIGAT